MKKASEIFDNPSPAYLDAMCCKYCRRMTAEGDICVQKDCVCHKESPVSQSVEWNSNTFPNREDITRNLGAVSQSEGWEWLENILEEYYRGAELSREQREERIERDMDKILTNSRSTTLSTLVKEMENIPRTSPDRESDEYDAGLSAGISAAVEVIKKMGI